MDHPQYQLQLLGSINQWCIDINDGHTMLRWLAIKLLFGEQRLVLPRFWLEHELATQISCYERWDFSYLNCRSWKIPSSSCFSLLTLSSYWISSSHCSLSHLQAFWWLGSPLGLYQPWQIVHSTWVVGFGGIIYNREVTEWLGERRKRARLKLLCEYKA
jgi:hypothetical protein